MPKKKRSDLWFFRTGGVVTIVGLKPTDIIVVNEKVRDLRRQVLFEVKQVNKISEVHGAKKRSK